MDIEFVKRRIKESDKKIMETYNHLLVETAKILEQRDKEIISLRNVIGAMSIALVGLLFILLITIGKCN